MRQGAVGGGHGGGAGRQVRRRVVGRAVLIGLAFAGIAGCARPGVENVDVRAVGPARPQVVVVHDFGVSPSAVALDAAIGARLLEAVKGNPEAEEQLRVGQEVPSAPRRRSPRC